MNFAVSVFLGAGLYIVFNTLVRGLLAARRSNIRAMANLDRESWWAVATSGRDYKSGVPCLGIHIVKAKDEASAEVKAIIGANAGWGVVVEETVLVQIDDGKGRE